MAGRFTPRVAAMGLALALAASVLLVANGCSRTEQEAATEAPLEEDPQSTALVRHPRGDASPGTVEGESLDESSDGGADASDGRVERELAMLADAGRHCGSRFLPDCPLQGWMKQHASALFTFGEISSIGEAFDEIAAFVPPDSLPDGGPYYQNWVSIAHDGARTVRTGNLNAARAACRACHAQYRDTYHATERARGLPDAAPLPSPAP